MSTTCLWCKDRREGRLKIRDHPSNKEEPIMELETFLQKLTNQAVPGGAAAAAHAAAMGAALLSKVARVALQRPNLGDPTADRFQTLWATAREQQEILIDLAEKDTQAYQGLLDLGRSPADDDLLNRAWGKVIDIPLHLAEACRLLLDASDQVDQICPPHLLPDIWIAQSLLTAGERAGVWCVQANLRAAPSTVDGEPFRSRLQALGNGTPCPPGSDMN